MNKSFLTVGLLLVIALLVFGCTNSTTSTTGSTGTGVSNPLTAFAQTFSNQAPAGFSITYNMNLTGTQTSNSVYVSQNKFRTDSTFNGVQTRVIVTDAIAAVCNQENSVWQCVETPATPEEKLQVYNSTSLNQAQLDELNKFQITEAPSRTVLGIAAKCFNMSRTDDNDTPETTDDETVTGLTCYHPNAFVTLYSELNTSQGNLVQEATAVSLTAPADSEFALPAALTSQPTE
ncbi:MAG: hypothetical protein Q7S92_04980 [Candidatus Diapherotrites archaeon]|nr:hypothetical protein [Candidatus Diapherotrites archaeon]